MYGESPLSCAIVKLVVCACMRVQEIHALPPCVNEAPISPGGTEIEDGLMSASGM